MNSSNTKVLEHLRNLVKPSSVRIVTQDAHTTGSSYLGSINVAPLHNGEDTAEKTLENGDTVLQVLQLNISLLQVLELCIVTLEAIVVSAIGVGQTLRCKP